MTEDRRRSAWLTPLKDFPSTSGKDSRPNARVWGPNDEGCQLSVLAPMTEWGNPWQGCFLLV
jgi:hypothetical protein